MSVKVADFKVAKTEGRAKAEPVIARRHSLYNDERNYANREELVEFREPLNAETERELIAALPQHFEEGLNTEAGAMISYCSDEFGESSGRGR